MPCRRYSHAKHGPVEQSDGDADKCILEAGKQPLGQGWRLGGGREEPLFGRPRALRPLNNRRLHRDHRRDPEVDGSSSSFKLRRSSAHNAVHVLTMQSHVLACTHNLSVPLPSRRARLIMEARLWRRAELRDKGRNMKFVFQRAAIWSRLSWRRALLTPFSQTEGSAVAACVSRAAGWSL